MPEREGLVRRYASGLVMETAPSYRGQSGKAKVLPGIVVRSPVPAHLTGAVVLRQAVALVSGARVTVSSGESVASVAGHLRQLLPQVEVTQVIGPEAAGLLGMYRRAVLAGGVVLLLWQAIARTEEEASTTMATGTAATAPSSLLSTPRWMLVVGVEGVWRPSAYTALESATALLVLDSTVPPVGGSGHNQHLKPGADPEHALAHQARWDRIVWTARTLDGLLECGVVVQALVLSPETSPGLQQ